jgi:hypothetical protein
MSEMIEPPTLRAQLIDWLKRARLTYFVWEFHDGSEVHFRPVSGAGDQAFHMVFDRSEDPYSSAIGEWDPMLPHEQLEWLRDNCVWDDTFCRGLALQGVLNILGEGWSHQEEYLGSLWRCCFTHPDGQRVGAQDRLVQAATTRALDALISQMEAGQ